MKRLLVIISLISIVFTALFLHSRMAAAASLSVHQFKSSCGSWTVVTSPNPGSSTNFLNAVAAIGAGNVWAVGSYGNGNGSSPLIEHWNNSRWTVVSSPTIAGSLSGIAAIAANNIWVVGENNSSNAQQTLVEHWNGKTWRIISSPNSGSAGSTLAAIAAVSSQDIWAVGTTTSSTSSSGYQPLIEHWNGAQWSISSSPALSGRLFAVTAVGQNDVWAVGDNITPDLTGTLIEHWNGTQWSVVTSPSPGPASNVLNAVVKVSANDVWAAGDYTNSSGPSADYSPLIEHWNGTQWSVVTSPVQGTSDFINGTSVTSARNITVVGEYRNSLDPTGPYFTLIEHWNGTQWSIVSSPSPGSTASDLLAATHVPKTKQTWAVGITYDSVTYRTLVEKKC